MSIQDPPQSTPHFQTVGDGTTYVTFTPAPDPNAVKYYGQSIEPSTQLPPDWNADPNPPLPNTESDVLKSIKEWSGNPFLKPNPVAELASIMLDIEVYNKVAAFGDKLRGVELNLLSIEQAVREGTMIMEMARQEARQQMLQAITAMVNLAGTIVAWAVAAKTRSGGKGLAESMATAMKANQSFEAISQTFNSCATIYEKIESADATLKRGIAEAQKVLIEALKSQTQQAAQQSFESASSKEDQIDKAIDRFFQIIHSLYQSFNWRLGG